MFSLRRQLGAILATGAALLMAAVPVTITFAQGYDYSYAPYTAQQAYPQYSTYQPQQQYQLYWCTSQGGYYSYTPCPVISQTPYYRYAKQYKYPQHNTYSYPQYYYPYMNYAYNYGSYNYSYNYNYSNSWGYWY